MLTVSWVAIVIAAIVKFGIGAIWYTALFGERYRALLGVPADAQAGNMAPAFATQIVGDLIMAYILARFIVYAGDPTLISGVLVGFMAWLGFVATIMAGTIYYEKRPPEFVAINAGYQLVGIVAMGAIIGWWG